MEVVETVNALRASDLTTKSSTARAYVARGSARLLILSTFAIAVARTAVGGFGRGDVIALVVTLVLTGTVEWFIHRFLLHATEDAWTSRTLGTGSGHRQHHIDPSDIDWLMLPGAAAAIFVVAFGLITAAWTTPVMWLTGSALLGPFLTAWGLATLSLAHYEWVHLLVHTRHRCASRYYAGLARNHRLHHYRNENYWLGITSNTGDRMLGTYPRDKTEVPLSPAARSLNGRDDSAQQTDRQHPPL